MTHATHAIYTAPHFSQHLLAMAGARARSVAVAIARTDYPAALAYLEAAPRRARIEAAAHASAVLSAGAAVDHTSDTPQAPET